MTQEQQREAIRLLRVVAASSMGSTYPGKREEWIGWQYDELEGVRNLPSDARKLIASLSGDERDA